MRCEQCADKLDRYVDRELTNTEALEVQLHLERFRIGQLAVDVAVELARTLFTSHCCGTCCMPSAWTIPDSTAYS